jgi:hypothetical protein
MSTTPSKIRHRRTQMRPAFQLLGTEKLTEVYAPASQLTAKRAGQSSEN